jgi:hypothetical protein
LLGGKLTSYHPPPHYLIPELVAMSSLQTFFRTVVMLATLGIVANLWYLYGPDVARMQAIGVRVVELSKEAVNNYWKSPAGNTSLASDPQAALQPAPFVPPSGAMQPIPLPPVTSVAPGPVQLANGVSTVTTPTAPPLAPATSPVLPSPQNVATAVPMDSAKKDSGKVSDLHRLLDLGVGNAQVKPWGNGGGLYRCSCDAPWIASPSYSRHFEAVATTAEAAVEQVAGQVAAWQDSQRRTAAGR